MNDRQTLPVSKNKPYRTNWESKKNCSTSKKADSICIPRMQILGDLSMISFYLNRFRVKILAFYLSTIGLFHLITIPCYVPYGLRHSEIVVLCLCRIVVQNNLFQLKLPTIRK